MNPEENPKTWLKDLILALNEAERKQGMDAVGLEWFRDVFLPEQGYRWAATGNDVETALKAAIGSGVCIVVEEPDSKNPNEQLTIIRLDRRNKKVFDILGEWVAGVFDFQPVDIRGEPLSDTVLGERR